MFLPFENVFESISVKHEIKQKNYKYNGLYPVVDQGEDFIGGYSDESIGIIKNIPLIAFGDHTRRFKYIDFPFIVGGDGLKLYKPKYTNIKFSYYMCLALDFPNKGYARHNALLKKCNFPVPPLAEQGRIVERIEEIFAKIDAGVEKIKSAQEKIKQYKQSVLHSAFTGKLYKTTEWKELPLKDVCKIILGQSPDSQTYNDDGVGLPFFQGKADFTNMYPVVRHYCSQFSKIAEINDILLSVRAPVGAVNISNCKCCIGRGLAALREIKDVSLYKFIYYLIKFKENELHKRETGTTFKAITGDRLKTVPISLPTLSEQERIVEEIEKRFAKADKMLEVVEKSLESAEQLKQSVLKKAFEGKLVPQDPNDEPASVLLERIKSEKQQNEKAKGKRNDRK